MCVWEEWVAWKQMYVCVWVDQHHGERGVCVCGRGGWEGRGGEGMRRAGDLLASISGGGWSDQLPDEN